MQCGFCTPGIVMSMLELLERPPAAHARADRRRARRPPLPLHRLREDRRGGRGRPPASHPRESERERPAKRRRTGSIRRPARSARRTRGCCAATGSYIADLKLHGMLHAAVDPQPAPARRDPLDRHLGALADPRVHGRAHRRRLRGLPELVCIDAEETTLAVHPAVLARDKVRYVGEPVAVIVAEDRYEAEDADDLIEVDYEPLPAVADPEAALGADAPILHEETNVCRHPRVQLRRPRRRPRPARRTS